MVERRFKNYTERRRSYDSGSNRRRSLSSENGFKYARKPYQKIEIDERMLAAKPRSYAERSSRHSERGDGWGRSHSTFYEGAESGRYFSDNKGDSWERMQQLKSSAPRKQINMHAGSTTRSQKTFVGQQKEITVHERSAARSPRKPAPEAVELLMQTTKSVDDVSVGGRTCQSRFENRVRAGVDERKPIPFETMDGRNAYNEQGRASPRIPEAAPEIVRYMEGPAARDAGDIQVSAYAENAGFGGKSEAGWSTYTDTPVRRRMERLIMTESFRYRAGPRAAEVDTGREDGDYLVDGQDAEPWANSKELLVDPDSMAGKKIKAVRLDLASDKLREDGCVDGRVVIDLREPVTLDSIVLNWRQQEYATNSEGKVLKTSAATGGAIPQLGYDAVEPKTRKANDIETTGKIPKTVMLPAGTNAIPFTMCAPAGWPPTVQQVMPNGSSVVSAFSLEAKTKLNGQIITPPRLTVEILSYGPANVPVVSADIGDFQLGLVSKYVQARGGTIEAILADETKKKADKAKVRLVRRIRAPELGYPEDEVVVIPEIKLKAVKKESEMAKKLEELGHPLGGGYKKAYEAKLLIDAKTMDSMNVGGLDCNYVIQFLTKEGTYECDVVLVDQVIDGDFVPRHISPAVRDATAWRKI